MNRVSTPLQIREESIEPSFSLVTNTLSRKERVAARRDKLTETAVSREMKKIKFKVKEDLPKKKKKRRLFILLNLDRSMCL